MNRALLVLVCLAIIVGLASGKSVNAQDCERTIEGNTHSPCKKLDYLDGIQSPAFLVEQFTDSQGQYACQSFLEFRSSTPLQEHSHLAVAGGSKSSENNNDRPWYLSADLTSNTWNDYLSFQTAGSYYWGSSDLAYLANESTVRVRLGMPLGLDSPVVGTPQVFPYLVVAVQFGESGNRGGYVVVSDTFKRPDSINDYQLLMNQCLAGINRQLELEGAAEEARKQASADKVRAETAAEDAKNQAELAAIELASAEAALLAAEELNAAKLQETILAIKREDAIRSAWQQVMLVRMAGLEERTKIWNEAVNRWAEEDLQFSSAMDARIQEVERLQALNAALEQSMADQRRILIAQLEELEKAEQEALQKREQGN